VYIVMLCIDAHNLTRQ